MKINLDKYKVTSDGQQFTVSELKTKGEKSKNAGEEYESNTKFFSTVEGIISHLLMQEIMESDIRTLKDMFEVIAQFKAEVKSYMKF